MLKISGNGSRLERIEIPIFAHPTSLHQIYKLAFAWIRADAQDHRLKMRCIFAFGQFTGTAILKKSQFYASNCDSSNSPPSFRPPRNGRGRSLVNMSIDIPYFGRVATAMVTPFKDDLSGPDYDVAAELAMHLVENGSDSLVICGTTGESPTLTWDEQQDLYAVVRDAVKGKAKIIAGAGSNSTEEALKATRGAAKEGLDGTLQVVPYYNKPPQDGLYKHFKEIALAEPDLPMMLYNIPGRTGVNMSPETIARLSNFDNVIACKQANNDLDELVSIQKAAGSTFHLYAGDDSMTLPYLALGATGVVSVASHFIGNEIQKMIQLYNDGDVVGARQIHARYHQLFSDLFCETNPIPVKAALCLQGWKVGKPRLPLVEARTETKEVLKKLFRELELSTRRY